MRPKDDLAPSRGVFAGIVGGTLLWLLGFLAVAFLAGCGSATRSPVVRDYTPVEMWILCAPAEELQQAVRPEQERL
ncbi:MAG: hypothetical protein Q8S13_01570 [Dehalococcoidia bacterium]|nr:hypothetical protein [Dehalococcoidia bacterium]